MGTQKGGAPPQQGFTHTSPAAQVVAPQATGTGPASVPTTGAGDGKVKGTSTHWGSPSLRQTCAPPSGVSMRPGVAHITATYWPGAAKRLPRHWTAGAP